MLGYGYTFSTKLYEEVTKAPLAASSAIPEYVRPCSVWA
jgi:hypothetical protein